MAAKMTIEKIEKHLNLDAHYLEYLHSAARKSFGDEEGGKLVVEFFKFFIMAINFPDKEIRISKAIDEIWHFAILETKHYRKLNSENNSGRFLDHSKIERDDAESERGSEVRDSLEFCLNYINLYGEFPSDAIQFWPQANQISILSKSSGENLNNFLHEIFQNASAARET